MTQALIDNLPLIAAAPDGIKALRGLILDLAVRGKLVPQDPEDEPASELLKRIAAEKIRLARMGQIKNEKNSIGHIPNVPFFSPNGWEWVRLGNILTKITDGTHHSPINAESGDFMYVSAKNIKAEGVVIENITYVTKEIHEEIYSRCNPEYGDILYVKDGATTGVVTINNIRDQFSMLSSVALLKVGTFLLNKYVLYALRSPLLYSNMRSEMTGVAITRVTLAKLNNTIVPLPPLAEQRRIVAKVDELMALCDRLEAQQADAEAVHASLVKTLLDTLTQSQDAADFAANWQRLSQHFPTIFTTEASVDALKQTVLSLGVGGKLVKQDPNEEPVTELLKRFAKAKVERKKETGDARIKVEPDPTPDELAIPLPPGWAVQSFENLFLFIDYRGNTPPKTESGIPLITAKNIRMGYLNLEPREYISVETFRAWMTRGFPKIGDLFFTTEAPLANICLNDIREPFALAQRAICLQPYATIDTKFLMFALMSKPMQVLIDKHATGMTARGIKAANLKPLPIPIPPLAEQHRIVAKVDELLALCDTLKAQIAESCAVQSQLAAALVEQTLAA